MQVIVNDKNVFGISAGTLSDVISEEENGILVNINGKEVFLAAWEYDVVKSTGIELLAIDAIPEYPVFTQLPNLKWEGFIKILRKKWADGYKSAIKEQVDWKVAGDIFFGADDYNGCGIHELREKYLTHLQENYSLIPKQKP